MNYSRVLFFLFSLSFVLKTQVGNTQVFSLGVKAGPLLSRSVIADKFDRESFTTQTKLGFMAAGLIIFPMKDNYSFETEFGASQRGRKILSNDDTWTNNATYYFFDGSMMLRKAFPFYLRKNVPSKWFVNIGPNISYWYSGKGEIGVNQAQKYEVVFEPMPETPPGTGPDFDKMYISNANRWLFGVNIGVGFVAPLKHNNKLLTELRFTSGHTFYGETNSAAWRSLGFIDNLRSNEKFLSLTAAYIFEFNLQEGRKGKSTKDKEVKRKPQKKRR